MPSQPITVTIPTELSDKIRKMAKKVKIRSEAMVLLMLEWQANAAPKAKP